jgi:hypothetical protein
LLALGFSLSEMKSRQAAHSGATLSAASHLPLQKRSRSFSMQNSTTETVASATRCSTCLALAIFVQLPIWVAFASAQSPSSAVREFGLFGTWADDCNTNPSPLNQYASFSISSRGTIQLRNDFGPDYGDMIYRIVDAKRIGLFRISLRQLLTTDDQIALDTVMLKSEERIRIWSSHGADGSAYVEDGLIPSANNHETGWMERCDTRWASDLNLVTSHPGR